MKPRKRKQKVKRGFSLLELCLSLSVLGIIASLLSWQTRDLYQEHKVQEGLKSLVIDMRQMQSLALSHRTDFELTFHYDKQSKGWYYTCSTDEPIPYYKHRRKTSLPGVKTIFMNEKRGEEFILSLYASGAILPNEQITFVGKKNQYTLDLSASPQIKLLDKSKT